MNIGEAITAPFQYPNWFPKVAKASVITFLISITIIGMFISLPNLVGWTKHVAEERMRGNSELPDFSLSYIGEGWRIAIGMFLYSLIFMLVMIPVGIVFGGLGAIAGKIAAPLALIFSLLMMLVMGVLYIVQLLGMPVVMSRVMFDGDTTAGVRVTDLIATVRANLSTCVMFFIAYLCISFLGSIAMYTFIGAIIFTSGYIAVGLAAALAQFRQSGVN